MKRTPFIEHISPFGKLLFFIGLILLFALVSALGGLALGALLFDVSIMEIGNLMSNPDNEKAISFLKFYQIINQVGVFILPALFFTYFASSQPVEYLTLNKTPKLISMLVGALIVYTVLPFNGYLDELNKSMVFPDFLSGMETWMKEKELQAKILTESFLRTNSYTGLAVNIIIVALLPAIGEEILFRGILIKLLDQMMKNIHLAVILSSIIFSAIHLQFYGFLPRLMLGLLLGYMFVFTRNLWVPIFVHFVNNASSVIVFYLHENGFLKVSMEEFGQSPNVVYVIGSLLITLWMMSVIYQKEDSNRFSGRMKV
jgi:membrane protease YdiL (CAAX protease family)